MYFFFFFFYSFATLVILQKPNDLCVHILCTNTLHIQFTVKPNTKPCLYDIIPPAYTAVCSLWAADDIPTWRGIKWTLVYIYQLMSHMCTMQVAERCTGVPAGLYMMPSKGSRESVRCHPVSGISLHFQWGGRVQLPSHQHGWCLCWQFQIDNGMRRRKKSEEEDKWRDWH